jgi:hypothetical protein
MTNAYIFSNLYCPGMIIQYILFNIIGKLIPSPTIFTETRTQGSFRVCDLSSCNVLAEMNKFCLGTILLSYLVSKLQKPSSSGLEARTVFRCCGFCSCNLLAEKNNFSLGTVLQSSLVSKILKPPSPGIEPRTVFRGCYLCFCNLLFVTNNFGLDAVLLSCLVSEQQKPCSPGIKPRTVFWGCGLFSLLSPLRNKQLWPWHHSSITISFRATGTAFTEKQTQDTFPEFWPSYVLFLVSRNKHAKFGVNKFIPSQAISVRTNILINMHTHNFNYIYKMILCGAHCCVCHVTGL